MSDTSLTISYLITSITNAANGMSTVVWSMSYADPVVDEARAGDKFKTADLSQGITSSDSGYDITVKVQANFENLAAPYFKAFAGRVRLAQDQSFANYLDGQTGDVSGFSVSVQKPMSGSVTVTG